MPSGCGRFFSGIGREGVEHVVFGDIFLRDLRRWREENLAQVGMQALFPLWQGTNALVAEFQSLGFRSKVCCVNDAYLNASHVGAELNAAFVKALPANVDPCGENGEYHSFTFAGPIFREPLVHLLWARRFIGRSRRRTRARVCCRCRPTLRPARSREDSGSVT